MVIELLINNNVNPQFPLQYLPTCRYCGVDLVSDLDQW